MNVGWLKAVIADLDDDMPVVVDGQYSVAFQEAWDAEIERVKEVDDEQYGGDEGFTYADQNDLDAVEVLYIHT